MSATKIPSGQTWFDVQKKHFGDIAISEADQGVPTTEFLDATESTTTMFDYMGSAVFTPIKNDLLFNIGRVRERQSKAPESSATLQALVDSELSSTSSRNATDGLTWLVRGLDFMAQAFKADLEAVAAAQTASRRHELADSFRASYRTTLAPYHNFIIRPIFKAAMSAAPHRRDFYIRLSGEQIQPETTTREKLQVWVSALENLVSILKTFLASKQSTS